MKKLDDCGDDNYVVKLDWKIKALTVIICGAFFIEIILITLNVSVEMSCPQKSNQFNAWFNCTSFNCFISHFQAIFHEIGHYA